MNTEKELGYRYDLFVTPDWRDRFDTLINENVEIPEEGHFLDVNCGTGEHAMELAEALKDKGEVVAVDPRHELIEIARAKAPIRKLTNITFQEANVKALPFDRPRFDLVIGDASMMPVAETQALLGELSRVAVSGGRVVLKVLTHGSFDELFSIYWEALLDCGLSDNIWPRLEGMIREHKTISEVEAWAAEAGLTDVKSVTSKEEFQFETGTAFLESPLIVDNFIDSWISIVPEENRKEVLDRIGAIIEEERFGLPFSLSIKATVVDGIKK